MSSSSLVIIRNKKGEIYSFEAMASSFEPILFSYKYYEENGDQLIIDYFKELGFESKAITPSEYGCTILDFKDNVSLEANRAGSLVSIDFATLELFLNGMGINSWSDIYHEKLFYKLSTLDSFKKILNNKRDFFLVNYIGEFKKVNLGFNDVAKVYKDKKYHSLVFDFPLHNKCFGYNEKNIAKVKDWIDDNYI